KFPESRQVGRCGDQQDVPYSREHQRRQGVVNHGLVVDREEALANRMSYRIKARARSARQNDALVLGRFMSWHSRFLCLWSLAIFAITPSTGSQSTVDSAQLSLRESMLRSPNTTQLSFECRSQTSRVGAS